jgi:hypothetical protein
MLKNTRKKTSSGRIQALNKPELIQVKETGNHEPSVIVSHDQEARVISIDDVWEIVDEWWRDVPISRRYYQVVVEGGTMITVFRDLINEIWYKQRV